MENVKVIVKTRHQEKEIRINLPTCKDDIFTLLDVHELFIIHAVREKMTHNAKQRARLSMK